ncbi:8-oxo-dGTP pyrophosphatase MutT (NUDIX family) [Limimaricola variabilis]|jgi:8-oxo-dGTP pyrophosphatase MutT (NUDIX family)|uniref:8-oxo-dGTP pyrophosphatase MutT (NUDIX family) n=1 Tax=Limimaricola variabilis TaxID=1492771 RepID=A0ABR6HME5_9RHOB|nr:NUDIX hydrolase [Limimaricola variabilis]MBB3711620.1 8-oxo-dGTP pyrophosphatase MutT (NUDIX family) [Limimaricola variabilis]WPY94541.1 NUDIX hydrolase [Limimaricola variabilis]
MTPKDLPDDMSGSYTTPIHRQLAALCHRKGKKGREVLLVTSSEGRWILPKGWPIDGMRDSDAALVEAWEEAGVREGKVKRKPIGTFVAVKLSKHGDEEICVTRVFEVKAKKVLDDYPEVKRRDRRWVPAKVAARLVTEDGLREILREM